MGWLVIVLGGVLSAVGVMAIRFGWEIVRDERGWTQVIAGSVGLSGGIVTIALGLIILALGGLRRDLRPRLSARSETEPAAQPERPTPPDRKPQERRKRKDLVGAEPAAAPPQGSGSLPMPQTDEPRVAPLAAAASLAGMHTVASEHAPAAPPRAEVDAGHDQMRQPEPDREAAPAARGDAETEVKGDADKQSPPSAEGLWPTRDKDLPLSYDRFEEELARLDKAETAAARLKPEPMTTGGPPAHEHGPDAASPAKQEASSQPEAEHDSPIVGQYEAGGVAYVMYADGSIRADTPNGVFRFSNINELKTFIQDSGAGPT